MKEAKKGVIREKNKIKPIKVKINNDPIYVGLDPSFTGTGVIVLNKDGEILEQKLIKSNAKKSDEERLIEIREELSFIPIINNLKMVYFEGPSFASNGQFMLQMGALHYVIRILFFESKTDYKIITPTELKKFVTGKGNAKKDLMLLKVYKKWGVEFSDNNMSDAYGLARMALEENKL